MHNCRFLAQLHVLYPVSVSLPTTTTPSFVVFLLNHHRSSAFLALYHLRAVVVTMYASTMGTSTTLDGAYQYLTVLAFCACCSP